MLQPLKKYSGYAKSRFGPGCVAAGCRARLHERLMLELDLIHVQLDELWANVKHLGQDMWVWVACEVTTKVVPVFQVGGRTQEMAYRVVHEKKKTPPWLRT